MLTSILYLTKKFIQFQTERKHVNEDRLVVQNLCRDLSGLRQENLKVLSIDPKKKTVKLEDYDDANRWKYLYALPTRKRGIGPSWLIRSRGKDSYKLVESGLREIRTGLQRLKDFSPRRNSWVSNAISGMSLNNKKLVRAAAQKLPKEGGLLTLELNGEKGGENQGAREAFTKVRLFGEARASSRGRGQCLTCGKDADVSPSIPFWFLAIVDKPSFRPSGDEDRAWTLSPFCEECTKWLHVSDGILKSQLSIRLAGKSAYLIPNLEPGDPEMSERFLTFLWHFSEEAARQGVISRADFFGTMIEDYPWDGPPPFRSISLMFYQPGQKSLFLRTTAEIFPKNLRLVSDELKTIKKSLRSGALGEIGQRKEEFIRANLAFVGRSWDTRGKMPLTIEPMELVEAILNQTPPNLSIFWSDIDKILRSQYLDSISSSQYSVKTTLTQTVIDIYILWRLLYRLGSNDSSSAASENLESSKNLSQCWSNFFSDKPMLDNDAKRACFLIGVLFGSVEFAQRRERANWKGEMPIMNRLRGLTITQDEIAKALFPELRIKSRQLKDHSRLKRELEEATGYYLSRASQLPDQEARYYFSLGWALDRYTQNFIGEKIYAQQEEGRNDVST